MRELTLVRALSGVAALLLLLGIAVGGCGESTRPASEDASALARFDLEAAKTEILSFGWDAKHRRIAMELRWHRGSESQLATVYIGANAGDPEWIGCETSIHRDGQLRFGMNVEFDPQQANSWRLREFTAEDELRIEHTQAEGSQLIQERYEQNGRAIELSFEAQKTLPERLSRDLRAFYDSDSTLDDNLDGVILVQLMSDDDFGDWYQSVTRRGGDGGGSGGGCPRWLSWGAAGCTALKCGLGGGVANPICHACFGTAWACWISDGFCVLSQEC